ncbi:glycoside hydrolase family 88 protein [Parasediminibacterium paludis]|uniref:Glycoside hydrolase family 88 protein n=1 Tax=Parasediminibacterium paludis TaxID=908966 RepID=A0ABV8PSM8_9BACT
MKKLIIIGLFCVGLKAAAQADYSAKLAKTAMTLWADTSAISPNHLPQKWSYDMGVVLKGIEGLWLKTADKQYFDYMQKCIDFFVDDKGVIRTYKREDYNIDNVLCGRILLTLFKVTGKDKYYKAAATLRDQLNTQPRTKEGGFWHKKIYTNQMWLDGLYMGEPFYAEWSTNFGDTAAYNDIVNQFAWMEKHSRDAKTGLLYHGWDESKEQQWANKTTGASPNFWARAMGWYGNALVDVIEQIPVSYKKRDTLVTILKRFATAVQKVQDTKTSLWYDILDKPTGKGNYLEASASSMFVYALAKGVRLGVLPASYLNVSKKGYDGILQTFIETDANGQANLKGTVSVSGLGGKPYRDGSYDYYMSEKVIVNDPKGIGAFIQAANEMESIPALTIGKGKTVTLDHYYNSEVKKDIIGVEKPFHYVWEEMDNNGFSLLGHVFNSYGVKTETLFSAPTSTNLKKTDIYLIVDADDLADNPKPNYVTEKDAQIVYDWVKAGGVLILFHNDKPNAEFEHFNILTEKFGIHFNEDSRNHVTGAQFEMGAFTFSANQPVFTTAKKVYLKEISTLKLSAPAISIFNDKGDVIMAVSKVGKGAVFAVGDPWVYNEYTDGRKLPADFDNFKAANDLVKWAIEQTRKK